MRWPRTTANILRTLFRRSVVERELDDELRFHLEMEAETRVTRGVAPPLARRETNIAFGGLDQTKEAVRDVRTAWLDVAVQDVRYALRSFRRTPGITLIAVLTLALGMCGVTTIFTVVDGVLFRPLPFPDSNRLVSLQTVPKSANSMASGVFSYPLFVDVRARTDVFEAVAAYGGGARLTRGDRTESAFAVNASAAVFRVLGVHAALGRVATEQDERPGQPRVAVITHDTWVRLFGADPLVVGKTLESPGQSGRPGEVVTVVGVLPSDFRFPDPRGGTLFGGFMPITPESAAFSGGDPRGAKSWIVIARLKRDVPLSAARTTLDVLAARVAAAYPKTDGDQGLGVTPLKDHIAGRGAAAPLLAFLASGAFLLLLACANVANLLVARASARRHEFGVRIALGASRLRIARQVLTESAVVSAIGGLLGVLAAMGGVRAFVALSPPVPRLEDVAIDYRVLAFTFIVFALATVISGLSPALRSCGATIRDAVNRAERGARTPTRAPVRFMVRTELALAIVLLVGGGLMINSFIRLVRADLGFDPTSVVALDVSVPPVRSTGPSGWKAAMDEEQKLGVAVLTERDRQTTQFKRDMVQRVAAVHGVVAAGLANNVPLSGESGMQDVTPGGQSGLSGRARMADVRWVTPGYFRTLSIKTAAGRLLTDADREGYPLVAVVNQAMAERLGGGKQAVDRRVMIGRRGPFRIVGVIADVKHGGARQPAAPEVYVADAQAPRTTSILVVKTAGTPGTVVNAVKRELARAGVTVSRIRMAEELLGERLIPARFMAAVLGSFSFFALLLALVGVHGVLAYAVVQRRHEIGVRLALGAAPTGIVRLVLRQALGHAVVGLVVGLAGGAALGQLLQSMLFEVKPTDPITLGSVAFILLAAAALAAYQPARVASRVNPVEALRAE